MKDFFMFLLVANIAFINVIFWLWFLGVFVR